MRPVSFTAIPAYGDPELTATRFLRRKEKTPTEVAGARYSELLDVEVVADERDLPSP